MVYYSVLKFIFFLPLFPILLLSLYSELLNFRFFPSSKIFILFLKCLFAKISFIFIHCKYIFIVFVEHSC